MRYQLRIIGGSLRGRKVTVAVDPDLRPMADRVREALFNILSDDIPGRLFLDLFAGSGAVGMEAISRGARFALFVEREPRAASKLIEHLKAFGINGYAQVLRADVYRWVDKWDVPNEPVNVFMGPPYREFERHFDAITWLLGTLQQKVHADSVLIVQSERNFASDQLPTPPSPPSQGGDTRYLSPLSQGGEKGGWDVRQYGRTQLAIWRKGRETQENAGA